MISILGALICLERAVALSAYRTGRGAVLVYVVPLLAAVGSILLATGGPALLAKGLVTLGSVGLVTFFVWLVRQHPAAFTRVMACGALGWLVGNVLWWTGQPLYAVVHWWAAFLILTVVGERLELSRVLRLTRASQRLFLVAVTLYVVGVVLSLFQPDAGVRLAGVGQLALAGWLMRYDLARHTIKRNGATRFIAACLLLGYGWLAVGGGFGLLFGAVRAGVQYESLLHALLLGFIVSMIFGHALMIIPAIIGRTLRFSPLLYVPLALLHLSLALRIVGMLTGTLALHRGGASLNVTAILLFAVSLPAANLWSRKRHPVRQAEQAA
jgi:hypothetical protein